MKLDTGKKKKQDSVLFTEECCRGKYLSRKINGYVIIKLKKGK